LWLTAQRSAGAAGDSKAPPKSASLWIAPAVGPVNGLRAGGDF
jgi:hypothetical protein